MAEVLMVDFLRIYILWAPGQAKTAELAERVSRHFDGLGMERDGVAIRVPVRFRSEPWDPPAAAPRLINLDLAQHNAVVLLHDDFMSDNSHAWDAYVRQLRTEMDARGALDCYLSFGSPDGDRPLPSDAQRNTQYTRRDCWEVTLPSEEARTQRFLLHLVFSLREHLRQALGRGADPEPLFVSHAKADGDGAARSIVKFVNSPDHDVPLQTFYDAMELMPGEDYRVRFEREISRGTLLAIVSDVYDSRPWCVFELTVAKRARRPIILADVGGVRTSRTYPYGANLPRIRIKPDPNETQWIEEILVETLSEGLRCDLFLAQARARAVTTGVTDSLVLPRPPELFDVVECDGDVGTMIYPDPPLGTIEANILERAVSGFASPLQFKTLSQLP